MKLPKVTQHVMQETRVELKMFPSLMVFSLDHAACKSRAYANAPLFTLD